MLVEELLEELEGMDKDAEVRLAIQPNYPMETTVAMVVQVDTDELSDEDMAEIEMSVEMSIDLEEFPASEREESIQQLVEQYRRNDEERRDANDGGGMIVYLSEDRHLGYLNSKASEELGMR